MLQLAQPYLDALDLERPAAAAVRRFRRYLQGMGVVRPIMVALVDANLVNAVFNWILIFGTSAPRRWACADRPGPPSSRAW